MQGANWHRLYSNTSNATSEDNNHISRMGATNIQSSTTCILHANKNVLGGKMLLLLRRYTLNPPEVHISIGHMGLYLFRYTTLWVSSWTYCKAHVQVFGNHKVAVPGILKMFHCEVDLSTVLTGMLARYHFFGYSIAREFSSGKCSILTAKSEWPSIYHFKLVR